MRRLLLLSLLGLPACGEDEVPPAAPKQKARPDAAPQAAAPPPAPADVAEAQEDAAAMLRRYYRHIEAGRYADAWTMRGGAPEGREAFARNFAAYQSYHVTVGQPSQPVTAGGWSFVEVPVMITGTLKGGKGFGSAGSISLRRASGAPEASASQRNWHIYTGD
jgi:hypothetical protein